MGDLHLRQGYCRGRVRRPVAIDCVAGLAKLGSRDGQTRVEIEGGAIRGTDVSTRGVGVSGTIPASDPGDYHEPPPRPSHMSEVAPVFLEAMKAVAPSSTVDPTRPMLRGVRVAPEGMAATDGRQMAFHDFPTGIGREVVIPVGRLILSKSDLRLC